MKKVLLGTSAIALAGAFASQANAVEWQVRVGGYMEQYAAFADNDVDLVTGKQTTMFEFDPAEGVTSATDGTFTSLTRSSGGDYDGIDSKQDAEIHFLPKIVLDNGLEFGADIQLEGNTSGDTIDESFMRIKGSFGELNLGSENSAGYKMTYGAPDVTFVGVNSGSLTAFVPFSGAGAGADVFRGTLGASFIETLRNNDAQRFTYYTPRFAGFQVGASYARDSLEDSNAQIDCDDATCDFVDVGANYVNSFGGFNVALSGRYGFASAPGPDPEVWAAGINLGYGGFTIGGSYADADKDHGVQAGEYWDAGVSYETGPWGFSFTVARGENVDNDCFGSASSTIADPNVSASSVNNCLGSDDEKLWQYLVGINYALAKGVSLGAFGAYVDFEGARLSSDDGEETDSGRTDIEGWVVGTGVKISF